MSGDFHSCVLNVHCTNILYRIMLTNYIVYTNRNLGVWRVEKFMQDRSRRERRELKIIITDLWYENRIRVYVHVIIICSMRVVAALGRHQKSLPVWQACRARRRGPTTSSRTEWPWVGRKYERHKPFQI